MICVAIASYSTPFDGRVERRHILGSKCHAIIGVLSSGTRNGMHPTVNDHAIDDIIQAGYVVF